MTLLPYSMLAVLSSHTDFSDIWMNPIRSRSLRRYRDRTLLSAVEDALYSTGRIVLDGAGVFCIFDRHMIGALLLSIKLDRRDELFPQSE